MIRRQQSAHCAWRGVLFWFPAVGLVAIRVGFAATQEGLMWASSAPFAWAQHGKEHKGARVQMAPITCDFSGLQTPAVIWTIWMSFVIVKESARSLTHVITDDLGRGG